MPSTGAAISLEELAELPEFYHPVVSPDGTRVAFYYDETGRNELHVLDRATGEYERVTDGDVPRDANWLLQWSADGDTIYFHRDDDGDEQYDLLAATVMGEVTPVIEGDGRTVLEDEHDGSLLYASDEGGQVNLYRFDPETGTSRRVTDYGQPVGDAAFAPRGERIAYLANESSMLENRDLYVSAADGSDPRRLPVGDDGSRVDIGGWFPDGERLLFGDDGDGFRRVGIFDLRTDAVTWLTPLEDGRRFEESAVAVGPRGDTVLAVRTRRAARLLVAYDVETTAGRELALPEGFLSLSTDAGRAFADATTVVVAHSTADRRKRLYEYDLSRDEHHVLLEAEYGAVDPETFVDAEYVTYRSDDGTTIGGLLYDARDGPAAGESGLPGVVVVHGGPHFHAARRFDVFVQFLVRQGYTVLQPNYRGSTGRGREFEDAIRGDWGGKEQDDIAAGGQWLADRDWIDEGRVAVFGASYGGYSVYCQLVHNPERWATGVAWAGITDLHRLHDGAMPHVRHYLRTEMGDPDENHDLWRERSPIAHVDALEVPLCILHGVNDPRCPVGQARAFRDELEDRGWEAGTDFEYHELGDEGHTSTDVRRKIRVFELLGDYLDRRL